MRFLTTLLPLITLAVRVAATSSDIISLENLDPSTGKKVAANPFQASVPEFPASPGSTRPSTPNSLNSRPVTPSGPLNDPSYPTPAYLRSDTGHDAKPVPVKVLNLDLSGPNHRNSDLEAGRRQSAVGPAPPSGHLENRVCVRMPTGREVVYGTVVALGCAVIVITCLEQTGKTHIMEAIINALWGQKDHGHSGNTRRGLGGKLNGVPDQCGAVTACDCKDAKMIAVNGPNGEIEFQPAAKHTTREVIKSVYRRRMLSDGKEESE
ncbi:hypothetical protein C8R42DRAFT_639778 [Lentinula raphanica]|nr:hypothetical protein C8R42DRAFT_639778 [Lentinula raphanica]